MHLLPIAKARCIRRNIFDEAGEFERKKGITVIEGNLEKFGIDGDGWHEFVRDY